MKTTMILDNMFSGAYPDNDPVLDEIEEENNDAAHWQSIPTATAADLGLNADEDEIAGAQSEPTNAELDALRPLPLKNLPRKPPR